MFIVFRASFDIRSGKRKSGTVCTGSSCCFFL